MVEILAITRTGDICLTVFLFLVGLVLIIKGGDWFVDSEARLPKCRACRNSSSARRS